MKGVLKTVLTCPADRHPDTKLINVERHPCGLATDTRLGEAQAIGERDDATG